MFLAEYLRPYWKLHQRRLMFLAQLMIGLLIARTVNWTRIANVVEGEYSNQVVYRRIQRFFSWTGLSQETYCHFVVAAMPGQGFTLAMDRTNWKLGKSDLNILMLGFVWQGLVIPLMWTVLDHAGNSNMQQRKALLGQLLKCCPELNILAFVADREFIGEDWLAYLKQEQIPRCIRIRQNTRLWRFSSGPSAYEKFATLKMGETRILQRRYRVNNQLMWLIGLRLEDDFLIVATDLKPQDGLATYGLRWGIETLFGCMKSRGFNLEDTHVTDIHKLSRLLILVAIAVWWAFQTGLWQHQLKPIPLKAHGRKAHSIFRLGLDHLQNAIINRTLGLHLISLLTCT